MSQAMKLVSTKKDLKVALLAIEIISMTKGRPIITRISPELKTKKTGSSQFESEAIIRHIKDDESALAARPSSIIAHLMTPVSVDNETIGDHKKGPTGSAIISTQSRAERRAVKYRDDPIWLYSFTIDKTAAFRCQQNLWPIRKWNITFEPAVARAAARRQDL